MAKKIPMRQCIGCGEMKNKKEMIRYVFSKRLRMKSYWMLQEKRMEEARIFVKRGNVLQRHIRAKDWNGLSK